MAYAKTVTVTTVSSTVFLIEIAETDVSSTDQAQIDAAPKVGRVILQECYPTGGADVRPILGKTTDPPGTGFNDVICEPAAAASFVQISGSAPYADKDPGHTTAILFHMSRPTIDHVDITSRYLVSTS